MKISKSLKKAIMSLAVCGMLLGSGASLLAPQICFADKAADAYEEEEESGHKEKPEYVEKAEMEALKSELNHIESELQSEKKDDAYGYVLYIAIAGAVLGIAGTGMAAGALLALSKHKDALKALAKESREINDLRAACASIKEKNESQQRQIKEQIEKLNKLEERVGRDRQVEIRYELEHNAPPVYDMRNNLAPAQTKKPEQREDVSQEYRSIKDDYNELMRLRQSGASGLSIKTADKKFLDKYQVEKFGCTNVAERQQTGGEPIFGNTDSPNFWAVQSKKNPIYFVFPMPKLSYEAQAHNNGGMKEAFASNYISGRRYEYFMVEEPALFTANNGIWSVIRQGRLRF